MKKVLNILLGLILAITVAVTGYAVVEGGSDASISMNLIWAYLLAGGAILSALFCAGFGMVQNPAGIKGTILSLVLVVAIIAGAYFYATSHVIEIPDLATGGVFPQMETVITEVSIVVTYVAAVAAIVTAIFTEIYKAFK